MSLYHEIRDLWAQPASWAHEMSLMSRWATMRPTWDMYCTVLICPRYKDHITLYPISYIPVDFQIQDRSSTSASISHYLYYCHCHYWIGRHESLWAMRRMSHEKMRSHMSKVESVWIITICQMSQPSPAQQKQMRKIKNEHELNEALYCTSMSSWEL